ncbi:hypothetical protein GCM10023196_030910 [Actinoallomurus vinaceus]|uniref:Uncharacterized protein n=1 Tax=Actinoallomurus vinaceus TaxID=1080074 RepID=A0ABP8U7R6_9ACTN
MFAIRHREAPPRLRAQVFMTAASLKITLGALGAAFGGAPAARSLTSALAVAAGAQAAAVACLIAPRPGRGRQPCDVRPR